jgi:hypothetical protein
MFLCNSKVLENVNKSQKKKKHQRDLSFVIEQNRAPIKSDYHYVIISFLG